MHDNPSICGQCKGKCCKRMPGAAYPSDFGHDFQKVREAIDSGKWCVDWWEGDVEGGDRDQCYYVRPATKGNEGITHDPSWGGECVLQPFTYIVSFGIFVLTAVGRQYPY